MITFGVIENTILASRLNGLWNAPFLQVFEEHLTFSIFIALLMFILVEAIAVHVLLLLMLLQVIVEAHRFDHVDEVDINLLNRDIVDLMKDILQVLVFEEINQLSEDTVHVGLLDFMLIFRKVEHLVDSLPTQVIVLIQELQKLLATLQQLWVCILPKNQIEYILLLQPF